MDGGTSGGVGVSFPSSGGLNNEAAAAAAVGGRHDNLVAVCLLTVASLCLGVMLYVLRPILIPFAVSLLFYYLLQPIVNTLNQVRAGHA